MIPKQLTLSGFMSFRHEVTINLDGLSFAVVTGENGAGKSSVILGLSWVIYGENRVGNDKDSIVNDHEEVATGVLDLEDSTGTMWRIRRTRNWRSSTELTVAHYDEEIEDWVTYGDHRISTAQDKIYEIVQMDEDAYHSLMVMKQSSMSTGTRFTAADSNQRRSILMGLLPELAIWSNLEASAGEMLYDVNRAIDALDTAIQSNRERARSYSDSLQNRILGAREILESGDSRDVDRVMRPVDKLIDKWSPDQEDAGDSHDEFDPLPRSKDIVKAAREAVKVIGNNAISKRIKKLEKEQQEHRSAIEASSDGRADLVSQLKTIRAERQARNAEIKSQRTDLQRSISEHEEAEKRVQQHKSALERYEADLQKSTKVVEDTNSEIEEFSANLVKDRARVSDYETELEDARDKVTAKEAEKSRVAQQIKALSIQSESHDGNAECLVCKSKLTHERVNEMLGEARDELEQIEGDLETLIEARDKAQRAHKRIKSRIADLEADLSDAKGEVTEAKSRIERAKSDIKDAKSELADAEDALGDLPKPASVQKKLDKLVIEEESQDELDLEQQVDKMDAEHPLSGELKRVTREIESARDSLDELNRLHGMIDSEADRTEAIVEEIASDTDRLQDKAGEKSNLEWIKYGCSQKGVPSMLIGDVLASIEDEQNALLERLMGDRAMRVTFKQEKELKSREGSKAALDIIVETPDGWERPIESFSGGEQIRLTFSNFFAMIKVFNERHPGLVDALLLDEPFGAIDRESIPIVVDVVREALDQEIVQSVIMVAHEQMVIDSIPQRLEFFRNPETDYSTDFEVL